MAAAGRRRPCSSLIINGRLIIYPELTKRRLHDADRAGRGDEDVPAALRAAVHRACCAGSAGSGRCTSAFRDLFRRSVRLSLALGALALGGAVLMTAVNVYGGLVHALDDAMAARGDDVDVRLLRPAPAGELTERALAIPGVRAAEAWGRTQAAIELPGAAPGHRMETDRYELVAPPAGTRLLGLRLAEGRWPAPDELGAVVVNGGLRHREGGAGLRMDAEIALLAGGRRTPVRVVGVVDEIGEPSLYTNARTLGAVTGEADGGAAALRVVTEPGAERRAAAALEEALFHAGWFPTQVMVRDIRRQVMADHFLIIVGFLAGAALSAVVVGGLGLATSMSLNALERSREIGVLRAMGATRRAVVRILLVEGGAAAALSAALAIALSVPLSAVVGRILGEVALHVALPLVISPLAVGGWIALAGLVTSAACLASAAGALRLPVREVLAHE
ncbi:ABC transporter permease [Sorangium sp. So ce321]|uniref:ABC transporter permease n=1 Tax=Sorangium sp. So ce321 TaxID=3133300 RepID=UPI003F5E5754